MNRLKELANEFNMSSYDFQKEMNISRNIIFNIYNNRTTFDIEKLNTFCEYFQVTADYFLCKSNEGIYVDVLGHRYVLSKEKFLLYREMGKITYTDKKRTLAVKSLDEIKFVNNKVPCIELIEEF